MPIAIDSFDPKGLADEYWSEVKPAEVSKQVEAIDKDSSFPAYVSDPHILPYKLHSPVDTYSNVGLSNAIDLFACMVKMSSLDKDRMVLSANDYGERAMFLHTEVTQGLTGEQADYRAMRINHKSFGFKGASDAFKALTPDELYYWGFARVLDPVKDIYLPGGESIEQDFTGNSIMDDVRFGEKAHEALIDVDYPDDHWAFHFIKNG